MQGLSFPHFGVVKFMLFAHTLNLEHATLLLSIGQPACQQLCLPALF